MPLLRAARSNDAKVLWVTIDPGKFRVESERKRAGFGSVGGDAISADEC
jgi:hypothetical protein